MSCLAYLFSPPFDTYRLVYSSNINPEWHGSSNSVHQSISERPCIGIGSSGRRIHTHTYLPAVCCNSGWTGLETAVMTLLLSWLAGIKTLVAGEGRDWEREDKTERWQSDREREKKSRNHGKNWEKWRPEGKKSLSVQVCSVCSICPCHPSSYVRYAMILDSHGLICLILILILISFSSSSSSSISCSFLSS